MTQPTERPPQGQAPSASTQAANTDTSAAFTGADTTNRTVDPGGNRWLILVGGVLVQLALGGVYAWSTFSKAFMADTAAMQLTPVQASLPFQLCIALIFVGAFIGGRIQDQRGPRLVALSGVVIYAFGILLSSLAREPGQLWLLILGYGVIGGFGLGLAYIVPIALLQKWFPDKRGVITGIAVGGFGFGAVITSPARRASWRKNRSPNSGSSRWASGRDCPATTWHRSRGRRSTPPGTASTTSTSSPQDGTSSSRC